MFCTAGWEFSWPRLPLFLSLLGGSKLFVGSVSMIRLAVHIKSVEDNSDNVLT